MDNTFEYKKVWVKRDDNTLEYKEWFIFSYILDDKLKIKINNFINHEIDRYNKKYDQVFNYIHEKDFHDLNTKNPFMPPRIIKLNKNTAQSFSFSIVKDLNNFFFGDDVGGIMQDDSIINNAFLRRELINYDYVLFNPGVIARIHYQNNYDDYYICQLDKKNLFKNKKILYTAFGGHLKYNIKAFQPYLDKYGVICKKRESDVNNNDVSFLIPTEHFDAFLEIFHRDVLAGDYKFFDDLGITIKRELLEELGPVDCYDGINLLTLEEINNFIEE